MRRVITIGLMLAACVAMAGVHEDMWMLMARRRAAAQAPLAAATYITDDPDNLMQYCRFWHTYDADADPIPDQTANANDADRTATGTTWGSAALEFDGSSGRADVGSTDEFDDRNFTVLFWVKSDDTGATWNLAPTITYTIPANVYGQGWEIGVSDDSAGFGLRTGSGGFADVVTYSSAYTSWRHVAIVASSSNHYLYVDGVLRASDTAVSAMTFVSSTGPLRIGQSFNAPNAQFLDGMLDDTSWFSVQFTSNQVFNASQYGRTE